MENTALLDAIIRHAIDGIITIDEAGLIESINPSGCKLFDYEAIEVIGQNISMLMPSTDKEQHNSYISEFAHSRRPNVIGKGREVEGLRKDGSVFPFRLGVSEVQFLGRIVYTGFIHDLTREKEAENTLKIYAAKLEQEVHERTLSLKNTVLALQQAKRKVNLSLKKEKQLGQLKSRFVSLASHEFRTPLSAVQLSASLIDKYATEFQSDSITKHVLKIKNAVSNLTIILNDFLSLEKLEAGKEKPIFTSFDLVKLSEEIAEEMQVQAKEHQAIIYLHTGTSSQVNLDISLLKICIVNLISNAIKYSGENTFIDFNTEVTDTICTVMVRDNGIGIPEADQEHLFEAFFRAHNTGNIPGTGLGLNIVARYTQLMDGKIIFKSNINQGAVFSISFPII